MSGQNFSFYSVASRNAVAQRNVPHELLPHEIDLIRRNPRVHPTQIPNVFVPFNVVEYGDLLVGRYGQSHELSSIIRSCYVTPVADLLLPERDDTYVIGLSYRQQEYADTQRSITGKIEFIRDHHGAWVPETPEEAAIRELQEEVGVSCDRGVLPRPTLMTINGVLWYTFAVDARELRETGYDEHLFIDLRHRRENAKHMGLGKVQVYVHGSLLELLELLERVTSRICTERDICGVRLLRSADIRNAFNLHQPSNMR